MGFIKNFLGGRLEDGFAHVKYNGQDGYASTKYLRKK